MSSSAPPKACLDNKKKKEIKEEMEGEGDVHDHWNPRTVSLEPMGDSYQNAARTIMKGYGNYGRSTHAQAHRSTKQAGRLGEGERDTEKERRGKEEG